MNTEDNSNGMLYPPYTVNEGELLYQPKDEIWSRNSDEHVGTMADAITTALDGSDDGDEERREFVDVASIGAGALNQAIKAVAVARLHFLQIGHDLVATPYFSTINDGEGRERTRLMLRVWRIRV